MSEKKEIKVDVSAFGGALDGFKFFVQQVEYRSDLYRTPTVHMQVLGVLEATPSGFPSRDVLQAEFEKTLDAAKNGDEHAMKRLLPLAEACMRADKSDPASLTDRKQLVNRLTTPKIGTADIKLASDALKAAADAYSKVAHGAAHVGSVLSGKRHGANVEIVVDEQTDASIYGRAVKAPVPEGVSIHHDIERRFTIAYSISKSGRMAFVGIAYCSPHDQFCRRTGRELAISRLNERPCRVVKLPRAMAPGTEDYPKNGAEWRAVEQAILLGLGLLR